MQIDDISGKSNLLLLFEYSFLSCSEFNEDTN